MFVNYSNVIQNTLFSDEITFILLETVDGDVKHYLYNFLLVFINYSDTLYMYIRPICNL